MKGINATLVDLLPETEYKGTVYERRGVLKPNEEARFGVFDPDLIFEKNQIGKPMIIILSLLISEGSIKKTDDREPQIIPNPDSPEDWKGHTFHGRIVEISDNKHRYGIWLDVGCGTIFVDPKKRSIGAIKLGDSLKIEALRTDLQNIK